MSFLSLKNIETFIFMLVQNFQEFERFSNFKWKSFCKGLNSKVPFTLNKH